MAKTTSPLGLDDISRNNLLSTRLYRILLQSCSRDVKWANERNQLQGMDNSPSDWILLQPPLDVRKYGHADIWQVRSGATSRGDQSSQVGRAMDVLKFVHTALGGNEEDDLEEYYLKSPDEEKESNEQGLGGGGAAAGRHSEGHYTHFLDEDDERGEGTSRQDEHDDLAQEELQEDYVSQCDRSVLVHCKDLINAVRIAFRAPVLPSSDQPEIGQSILTRRHRDAIDAYSLFTEQIHMWANKSSICVNKEHGVRIVATSSYLQYSTSGVRVGGKKYKFAYRIRVENLNDASKENKALQLLGRTWNIYEARQTNASSLTMLLEEDSRPPNGEQEEIQIRTLVQRVHEPKTGAVGHFPVIRPGEVRVESSILDIGRMLAR